MDGRLITEKELAELLGMSPAVVARKRRNGMGPRFTRPYGGDIRYRREDVDEWLEQNAADPAEVAGAGEEE